MKAILVGATGAVGKDLLDRLLQNDLFEEVKIFVRRDINIHHPKLQVYVIDFEKPEIWSNEVKGDVLFSCLGTTLKQAGGKAPQWRVDHDYQLDFARAASNNGVKQYVLVSSIGANAKSINFYTRMKGVLENDVKELKFRHIAILQPSSLIRKGSDRLMERLGVKILQYLNRVGLLYNMRPIGTDVVADCMIRHADFNLEGIEYIKSQEISSR